MKLVGVSSFDSCIEVSSISCIAEATSTRTDTIGFSGLSAQKAGNQAVAIAVNSE